MGRKSNIGSVKGYVWSLPKATILGSSAEQIMNAAPATLAKKKGTWGQAVSARRTQLRQTNGSSQDEKAAVFTATPSIGDLPVNVRERVSQAMNDELDKIEGEVKTLREAWNKVLTPQE